MSEFVILLMVLNSDDAAQSSTYNDLPSLGNFSAAYLNGNEVNGTYFGDNILLGGLTVNNLTMILADQASQNYYGYLGIGMIDQEVEDKNYYNLPAVLVEQGLIGSYSYSLYLDEMGMIAILFSIPC